MGGFLPIPHSIKSKCKLEMNSKKIEIKKILITGAAGFIGANLVKELLKEDDNVHIIGIDNMNTYYDVSIKEYRLSEIDNVVFMCNNAKWTFIKADIADKESLNNIFEEYRFDVVVNLAAQAGVRYSIENPYAYLESNLIGFFNILEACRIYPVEHLVYASSSSVYGANKKIC